MLRLLETPIYERGTDGCDDVLPRDIQSLHDNLLRTGYNEGVIPNEVLTQVRNKVGAGRARPSFFCEQATPDAGALHTALCDISREAIGAQENEYHESGWNHCVHWPLLKLVFSSTPPSLIPSQAAAKKDAQPKAQPEIQVKVRVVAAMAVTILSDCIPGMADLETPTFRDASAPAAASSETSFSSLNSSSQYPDSEYPDTEYGQRNRSDSKKVDYVLAIDPLDSTPLDKVISFWTQHEAVNHGSLPHVNQTLYRALQKGVIACSIETRVEFQPNDPLLQLGIWTAAWHKRMYNLRKYILNISDLPSDYPSRTNLLPSTLLIEVVGHLWRVYFVCDRSTSIDLYGPFPIGSTGDLVGLYGLVASLKAIKAWIETAFSVGMSQWLMCNEQQKLWKEKVAAEKPL